MIRPAGIKDACEAAFVDAAFMRKESVANPRAANQQSNGFAAKPQMLTTDETAR